MNSFITFNDASLFKLAVTALELDASPEYEIDEDALRIWSDDAYGIGVILNDNGIFMFEMEDGDTEPDDDMDGDFASAMASAGHGTDEDYGSFGGGDE